MTTKHAPLLYLDASTEPCVDYRGILHRGDTFGTWHHDGSGPPGRFVGVSPAGVVYITWGAPHMAVARYERMVQAFDDAFGPGVVYENRIGAWQTWNLCGVRRGGRVVAHRTYTASGGERRTEALRCTVTTFGRGSEERTVVVWTRLDGRRWYARGTHYARQFAEPIHGPRIEPPTKAWAKAIEARGADLDPKISAVLNRPNPTMEDLCREALAAR
jgi:hypothetical protein